MLKKSFLLFSILLCTLSAHGVLLLAEPAGDSVYIEAGLSSGKAPGGAEIILSERATGRPLWNGPLPESGHLTVEMPDAPYTVSIKLDDAHTKTVNGPRAQDVTPDDSAKGKADTVVEPPLKSEGASSAQTSESTTDQGGFSFRLTLILLAASLLVGFFVGTRKKG
ncbi:MAG: hypothetical protein ACQEQV_01755 [Fibrobacterota bacterium]